MYSKEGLFHRENCNKLLKNIIIHYKKEIKSKTSDKTIKF